MIETNFQNIVYSGLEILFSPGCEFSKVLSTLLLKVGEV
jgi:hypothetical protein